MLCQQLEYFGPGTFQQQLDNAYKDFIAFARTNKMDHSQPPFKESKVTWQNSLIVFFDKAILMGTILSTITDIDIIYITPQSKVRYHDEVSLNAKAWNGRVVCCWLAETLPLAARGVPVGFDEGRLSLVCYALILGRST